MINIDSFIERNRGDARPWFFFALLVAVDVLAVYVLFANGR